MIGKLNVDDNPTTTINSTCAHPRPSPLQGRKLVDQVWVSSEDEIKESGDKHLVLAPERHHHRPGPSGARAGLVQWRLGATCFGCARL